MKIFRKISEIRAKALSYYRIFVLKLKYNNIEIGFNSYIGKNCQIHCDNDAKIIFKSVHLADGVVIHARRSGKIIIEKCYFGFNCVVFSMDSITIGENVEIAEMVVIRDQDHRFDFSNTPISQQGFYHAPIKIGNNTWIGAKATILKGVSIGDNCLIGAHSLVNKGDFPDGSFIVGSPAKNKH